MSSTATDLLTLEDLAEAVASKINIGAPTMKRVFNMDEAANYCGVSRESFKKKVIRDHIRKVRLDKCWRFDRIDLDAWIDAHKEQLPGEAARRSNPVRGQGI